MQPAAKWCLRALALILFCGLRIWHLDADPPVWLSWSMGTLTDEGFYSLDARHVALFGGFGPGNFHDHLIAPLLFLVQVLWFRLAGTEMVTLRLLSVAASLLSIVLLWIIVRRIDETDADIAAGLFALAPESVFYARLGLQESSAVACMLAGICIGTSSRASRPLWILSGVIAGLAVGVKSLSGMGLAWFLPRERPKSGNGQFWYPLIGIAIFVVTYFAFWFLPNRHEIVRMSTYYRVHQFQPHSLVSVYLNVRRGVSDPNLGVLRYFLRTLPVLTVSAILCCFRVGKLHRSETRSFALKCSAWLAVGFLFCLMSSYAPSRYYVLFLPALVVLGVLGLRTAGSWVRHVAITVSIAVCCLWDFTGLTAQSYTVTDAQRAVKSAIPAYATLTGEMAPSLALGSKIRTAPVQPGLSNDVDPVESTGAHFIAITRSDYWDAWWHVHAAHDVHWESPVLSVPVRGAKAYVVDIYRTTTPF